MDWGRYFSFFGGVPMSSHHVPEKVLMYSHVVPQVPNVLPKGVPNST